MRFGLKPCYDVTVGNWREEPASMFGDLSVGAVNCRQCSSNRESPKINTVHREERKNTVTLGCESLLTRISAGVHGGHVAGSARPRPSACFIQRRVL
ncbi:Uncharacterized protein DAT39_017512 [Clarias magur]|uniref:Uncharacterized protein n=1 Tax=Clarias magur TaxID=1594786 RepID=A0A8J4U8L1_CLAMG|nr:Uncharacterized protein DAT39_017512 [Clarias magur]